MTIIVTVAIVIIITVLLFIFLKSFVVLSLFCCLSQELIGGTYCHSRRSDDDGR